MEPVSADLPSAGDGMLAAVRRRSRGYLGYLFWALAILFALWAANAFAALVERYVGMLGGIRRTIGLAPPAGGPDYWIIGGLAVLAAFVAIALAVAYGAYRRSWSRRLEGSAADPHVRRLYAKASDTEMQRRAAYLNALLESAAWRGSGVPACAPTPESYRATAEAALRVVETDVASRAVTVGLVVGLNRNPVLDTLSIAGAAFEMQLHVLTMLGKRPSARTWIELVKRTGASLFLNTYVTRDDALYINLAIRKAALGLELASDSVQEAATALNDVDWDEVLGGMSVPGLSAVTSFATMSMSVGAFGLRHLGGFIETTANDLLQGVLAAGVLYYHGMALAAECLALDREHRESAAMNRTVAQAMAVATAPAGRLLRDQVRRMREFLRERRRLIFSAAKEAAKEGVDRLKTASTSRWDRLKESSGLFRPSGE